MPEASRPAAWPLALTISGVALVAFGAFVGIDWLNFSFTTVCDGPAHATCSSLWPDPRLPLPLLVIGSGLVLAGMFSDREPRRGELAGTGLSVTLLVVGSGVLEAGISLFNTYVFSSSWMFYLAPIFLGTGVTLLTGGAWHWGKARGTIE